MNSKTAAPSGLDRAANIVPVPGEAATASASDQAKGDAVRTVEEAVARTERPPKPAAAKKASSSAGGDRAGKSGKAVSGFTQDEVALRAYFIAEKRRALGLPGDEHQDWIQAEQQLIGESRRSKKPR